MEKFLRRLLTKAFTPTGIIDVGAHDGFFARAARNVFPDAHIFMVDALAEKEGALSQTSREIGNANYEICLLGEHEVSATPFYVVDMLARPDLVTTGSSKFRENSVFPMTARSIPQRQLASLLAERDARFELIKLDVQGAELEVLKGFGSRLSEVEVIITEISLLAYNEGAPLIDDVVSQLRSMGFCLYDIAEEHRYRDGTLLQIDGVFVRPESSLRPRPPFWA